MADLAVDICGIRSPNPFWLASGPPTNSGEQVMRAFEAGWGGAVWKTLGNPIVNLNSRFAAIDRGSSKIIGFNNIELITDRPLDINFKEIAECKKRYPKHVVIASLMVETRQEWRDIIARAEDAGADGHELNFGCPHGMCERGMGSSVGQEPEILSHITSWAKEFAKKPVFVKLTPNISDILDPGFAAVQGGADGLALINTIKSLIGVDLQRFTPLPRVGAASTNGGYCGPAVKPIALQMVGSLARDPRINIPISGIGGISDWRDAAEFLALGATTVQVCTAVMHKGYRIVRDMLDGLSRYLDQLGLLSVTQLIGRAVPQFREWGDLDLNYRIVAEIDSSRCIGCRLCYVACLDGAHQCIHLNDSPCQAHHGPADHGQGLRDQILPPIIHQAADPTKTQVPFIDVDECIGCNLCALVCPVPDCIQMRERPTLAPFQSWNDRVRAGAN